MNFDFIKNLDGLGKSYSLCDSAEKLVKTIPDASMIESRKSAEQIAKMIYLVAHSEIAERIDFLDILKDYEVRRYLHNRELLDAFHFVRINGNEAVHTDKNESPEAAMAVLEKLHFVVGEVAKRMNLISDYPVFNDAIESDSNAKPLDPNSYESLGKEMYEDYIISKFNVERLKDDYYDLKSPFQFDPGLVDLNEYVDFEKKPTLNSTLHKTQQHFAFIGLLALRAFREGNEKITCDMELEIKGEKSYKTNDLIEAIGGILYDLPVAESFKITSYYTGPSLAPWFNNEARFNAHDDREYAKIMPSDMAEHFIYKSFEFIYNHGEGVCRKCSNGHWFDSTVNGIEDYSDSILDNDYEIDWWCWNINLVIDFDFDEHKDIIDALHDAVREHAPKDQLQYCEETWEDEPGILLDGVQWHPRKLRDIQDFLDKVNALIKPIISECDVTNESNYESCWYLTKQPFGFATMIKSDKGFKIVGTT